jgi:phosphohistidine phosphatase
MKRLILIRHAKSDWDDPFNGDHNRRLNARGHRAAGLVGAWLAEHGYLPDHVQCSTATRCIETWQEIKEAADLDLSPEYEKGIYHASSDVMLKILSRAEGDTVMMLGHNPGISDFAERLIKGLPVPNRRRNHSGFRRGRLGLCEFRRGQTGGIYRSEGPREIEKPGPSRVFRSQSATLELVTQDL